MEIIKVTVRYVDGDSEELRCKGIKRLEDCYECHTTDGFVHCIGFNIIREIEIEPDKQSILPPPAKKLPIGAKPHRIHNQERIKELVGAISRSLDETNCASAEYTFAMALVAAWAEEIQLLAEYEKGHPDLEGF